MTGCLYDTNVLLWFLAGDARLTKGMRKSIEDRGHRKFVSIASAWEVAIKISLGKLEFEGGASEFWHIFTDSDFEGLPISMEAVGIVQTLPFHHKDPFDRILVATALGHGLKFVSGDKELAGYFL